MALSLRQFAACPAAQLEVAEFVLKAASGARGSHAPRPSAPAAPAEPPALVTRSHTAVFSRLRAQAAGPHALAQRRAFVNRVDALLTTVAHEPATLAHLDRCAPRAALARRQSLP